MVKRKYRVKNGQDLPRLSHRSWIFPECLYTLERQEDGKVFRVTLEKSLGWRSGDLVEVEDWIIETVKAS